MRTDVKYRVVVAGAELRMLVLAADWNYSVGVDLDSGAFVRTIHPRGTEALAPLDVATAAMGYPIEPPDPACPEAVELIAPPRRLGRIKPRRAERYLQPLHHPPQGPLLGFQGVAVPYWTITGDRPSMALVKPTLGPQLRLTDFGLECRFAWQGAVHQFPVADHHLLGRLDELDRPRLSGRELTRLLDFRPRRLLLMVSAPDNGYCYKQVAAFLPAA